MISMTRSWRSLFSEYSIRHRIVFYNITSEYNSTFVLLGVLPPIQRFSNDMCPLTMQAPWHSGHDIHDFCCCHLWCWWSLLSEHCIGFRVVFDDVTWEQDSSFVLLAFWFQLHVSWDDRCPSLKQSGLSFFLFVLPESCPSCSSLYPISTLATFRACLIHCPRAAFASGIFIAWGIGMNLCNELNPFSAMWSSWLLGRVESERFLVDSWASTMHACFVLTVDSAVSLAVSCRFFERFFVPILQNIAAFIGTSNFFLAFFDGLLKLSIFRIDEMNTSQSPSIIEFRLLDWSLLLLLLSCSSHARPPKKIRSGSCLDLCPSRDHIFPSGGFSFNTVNFVNPFPESVKLRSTSTFQQSSVRFSCNTSRFLCEVLVTSKAKSPFGFQRHPLFLSVETSPSFLEVLPWDLHSLQVVPALEWILGFRSLFQTMLLFQLRLGIYNFHIFSALWLPLQWAFVHGFLMRPNFQLLNVCNTNISFPHSSCDQHISDEYFHEKTFLSSWWSFDWSLAEIRWYSTIAPNGITGQFKWFSEAPVTIQVKLSFQIDGFGTDLSQL